jgi:hypothetical protein
MTDYEQLRLQAEIQTARRQTMAAAAVGFFGNVIGALLTASLQGWRLGNALRLGHAIVCAVVFGVLALRRRPQPRLVLALFAAMTLPLLPFLYVWTTSIPQEVMTEAYVAIKMVIMGVALLTPYSLALGLVLMALFTGEAVLFWAMHIAGHIPSEPWTTLFYAGFACGLLLHRASERSLARRLWQANAEAATLERIARVSLDVRDRVNSPLQTLEVGLELLRVRCEKERTTVERLRSAVGRLVALSQQLDVDRRRAN